jgi:hypothetical protein
MAGKDVVFGCVEKNLIEGSNPTIGLRRKI